MLNRATSDFDSWKPRPNRLELAENEIHVWRASVECDETVLRQFEATLSSDEQARAERFVFPRDRNRFIAVRGILRELLGRYVSRPPADIEFDYGPQGKPGLSINLPQRQVQFNVSHSHGVALLAFARGRQLGVDVELVRPDIAREQIAERYFSPQEVMELRRLPPSLQDEGFFLCWTRKEAYIKALGGGLTVPLNSFQVSLTPGKPEELRAADSSHWSLRSLRPDQRHVGALVVEGGGWELCSWDWRSNYRE
jgi:4'-phosphopantetheinyl transferase